MQNLCDAVANGGFRITEVALAGEHEVGRDEILVLAGITDRSSLLFLDAARTRARLLTNPWIADATVLKLYPDRLRIEIKERKPFALWQNDGHVSLIAADGTVLRKAVPPRFAGLPLVVGKGAEQSRAGFPRLLIARYPAIAQLNEASVLVAERRWNLHLKGGVEVLLPENEAEQALRTLVDLDRNQEAAVARHHRLSICGCPIASPCVSPTPPPPRASRRSRTPRRPRRPSRAKGGEA